MRVFLTGATGFIGSHVIPELLGRGHHVLGLTRSDVGAQQLERAGVEVHRGDLEQPETLASGVAQPTLLSIARSTIISKPSLQIQ